MNFEFTSAGRILFGAGTIKQVPAFVSEFGHRAMVVAGVGIELINRLIELLRDARVESMVYHVNSEPTVSLVEQGLTLTRKFGCQVVIGFGGGSALDTAKAIAVLLNNPGDILDYLEVVGKGKPLLQSGLPCVAIPTTAGTGAEVTRNAVLGVPERQVKVSLRSPTMLPRLAVVDPELTYGLPPALTASTGLDALTQLIEPFVSTRSNPMTDALCREGMRRVACSLRRVYENGQDVVARENMSLASMCGGLALANARLGAVHGFAAPFGGMFPAPHGAICARLLPFVMKINLQALRVRQPQSDALLRYNELAQILIGDSAATANDGVAWIMNLCDALQVPPLSIYGFGRSDFPALIERAARASSMQGNPIALTVEELGRILEQAYT